ncbi:MAG TPA: YajQ family cyclic di-GMP-binding protein [Gemmatimonadales bacterium]|nr:YajQ family cyclic di-GMP-binding protein [Gemmatimonadales bacterium]HJS46553.1 YajQ family cyclic di-GMP-binding protein [Gemmatimonadales bacterium]
MAANPSFDVSTGCDLQEVDNAVNQALKEIGQRYDFKGTKCEVVFDRPKAEIRLLADDDFRMDALVDVLRTRLVKRNVPVKNLTFPDRETASHGAVRQTVALTQGLSSEVAKRIVRTLKDNKALRKVTAAIQGDEVRVTSPSKDDLQAAIAILRAEDFGVELQFGNYRS